MRPHQDPNIPHPGKIFYGGRWMTRKQIDEWLARTQAWRKKNREHLREYERQYRKENAKALREYREENLEKRRECVRRSARKARGWYDEEGMATKPLQARTLDGQ